MRQVGVVRQVLYISPNLRLSLAATVCWLKCGWALSCWGTGLLPRRTGNNLTTEFLQSRHISIGFENIAILKTNMCGLLKAARKKMIIINFMTRPWIWDFSLAEFLFLYSRNRSCLSLASYYLVTVYRTRVSYYLWKNEVDTYSSIWNSCQH